MSEDEREYAENIVNLAAAAMEMSDQDGKDALHLACDVMAFLISEQSLEVGGIMERIQEARLVFDDADDMVRTGQNRMM